MKSDFRMKSLRDDVLLRRMFLKQAKKAPSLFSALLEQSFLFSAGDKPPALRATITMRSLFGGGQAARPTGNHNDAKPLRRGTSHPPYRAIITMRRIFGGGQATRPTAPCASLLSPISASNLFFFRRGTSRPPYNIYI